MKRIATVAATALIALCTVSSAGAAAGPSASFVVKSYSATQCIATLKISHLNPSGNYGVEMRWYPDADWGGKQAGWSATPLADARGVIEVTRYEDLATTQKTAIGSVKLVLTFSSTSYFGAGVSRSVMDIWSARKLGYRNSCS